MYAGHNWEAAELTPYRLKSGSEPVDSDEVVVDSRLGLDAGEPVEAATLSRVVRRFEVSGVADTDRLVDGAKAARSFQTRRAQTLSDRPGRVNAVRITLTSGANLSEVSGALHERLGPTVKVSIKRTRPMLSRRPARRSTDGNGCHIRSGGVSPPPLPYFVIAAPSLFR